MPSRYFARASGDRAGAAEPAAVAVVTVDGGWSTVLGGEPEPEPETEPETETEPEPETGPAAEPELEPEVVTS
jgi:hypothetical protein